MPSIWVVWSTGAISNKHVLVLMDDVSRFVWLEETVSCSMELAARSGLKCCASFGVPKAFTSDGGMYFTRQVMQMVSSRLGMILPFRRGECSVVARDGGTDEP